MHNQMIKDKAGVPMQSSNIRYGNYNTVFLHPEQEQLLAAAGERHLQSFAGGKRVKKGFAVLSNANLYLFGKNYQLQARSLRKSRESRILELYSVRRVSILHRRPSWLLGLCYFFLLLAPVMALLELVADVAQHTHLSPLLDAILCLIFAAVCWLLYSAGKQRLLAFHSDKGVFAVDTRYVPEREETNLVHKLRAVIGLR